MPGCIISSPEGLDSRHRLEMAAKTMGSRLMPRITQFCDFHKQHHVIEMHGDLVESRYGRAPVEVDVDESKPEAYHHRAFCGTCSSYHNPGDCRGQRSVEAVGS